MNFKSQLLRRPCPNNFFFLIFCGPNYKKHEGEPFRFQRLRSKPHPIHTTLPTPETLYLPERRAGAGLGFEYQVPAQRLSWPPQARQFVGKLGEKTWEPHVSAGLGKED